MTIVIILLQKYVIFQAGKKNHFTRILKITKLLNNSPQSH